MFRVLQAEEIGMQLTESYAMYPGAAVSGFYLAHPDSKYFSVGKIGMTRSRTWPRGAAWRRKKSSAGWRPIF